MDSITRAGANNSSPQNAEREIPPTTPDAPLPAEVKHREQAVWEQWCKIASDRALFRTYQVDAEFAQLEKSANIAVRENGELREALEKKESRLSAIEDRLSAIEDSRGYKFLQKYYAVRLYLFPRGGKRERIAASVYRRMRSIFSKSCESVNTIPAPADSKQERGDSQDDTITDEQYHSPPAPIDADLKASATAGRCENSGAKLVPKCQDTPIDRERSDLRGVEKSLDSEEDWHLGMEEIRYDPRQWTIRENVRSDDRFIKLIILSVVHRTGSTLLQRLCNARKETLIWGEHGGFLAHYADIYAGAAYFSYAARDERDNYFARREDPNCWIASMTPDMDFVRQATVESARTFLNALYEQFREGHDVIGFKEVHYVRGEMELIRKCYPEATILLLNRNPLNTWRSTPRAWYPSFEAWMSKWKRNSLYFLDFAKHDLHCHLLRYEDIVRRDEKTMNIVADAAKINSEQIESVLSCKIGSSNYGLDDSEREAILENCREPMAAYGYLE
jgi:hypothetical protein